MATFSYSSGDTSLFGIEVVYRQLYDSGISWQVALGTGMNKAENSVSVAAGSNTNTYNIEYEIDRKLTFDVRFMIADSISVGYAASEIDVNARIIGIDSTQPNFYASRNLLTATNQTVEQEYAVLSFHNADRSAEYSIRINENDTELTYQFFF